MDVSEQEFAAIGQRAFLVFASKNAMLSTKVFDLDVFDGLASTGSAGARPQPNVPACGASLFCVPIRYLCYLCDLLSKILSLRSSVRRLQC